MSNRKLMLDDPAEYYRQVGAEQERERIIKLLEDKQYFAAFLLDWAYTKPTAEDALTVAQTVIALIKGEQK
jgi:hypothetical protein